MVGHAKKKATFEKLTFLQQMMLENEVKARRTIRLVASENPPTPINRLPYILDMYARYSFSGEHDATTGHFPQFNLGDMEKTTAQHLGELLGAKHVNIRPISGMNSMLTAIAGLAKAGRPVLTMGLAAGGHGETKAILQTLGLSGYDMPFDPVSWGIDFATLESASYLSKVALVYLDLCMILFPQPLEQLRQILPKDALIVYDASHVLGLICGDMFQDPLAEGADVLIGSTHKSFPGPHKAIMATNRRLIALRLDAASYHFTSHHHVADSICLGLVAEQGKDFFRALATKTVSNAQRLGRVLYNNDVKVQFAEKGFTKSHQLWIDAGSREEVDQVVRDLESLGIIVNSLNIPNLGRIGIRLGLQELTHLSIEGDSIDILGEIIGSVITKRKPLAQLRKVSADLATVLEAKRASGMTNFFEMLPIFAGC